MEDILGDSQKIIFAQYPLIYENEKPIHSD